MRIWGAVSQSPDEEQLDIQMSERQWENVSFESFLETGKRAYRVARWVIWLHQNKINIIRKLFYLKISSFDNEKINSDINPICQMLQTIRTTRQTKLKTFKLTQRQPTVLGTSVDVLTKIMPANNMRWQNIFTRMDTHKVSGVNTESVLQNVKMHFRVMCAMHLKQACTLTL